MAANKFATMMHRNTNKVTLILIYAVLEWVLIVLLLLNSLFSYLIIKFADFFGLKTPCLWCSRVDHIFEPGKNKNFHRDLLCEAHATEVSKLGFCSCHRKLAESQDMCEDCSSSLPENHGITKNLPFFPWVKPIGMIESEGEKVTESGEVGLKCSCCGVCFDRKLYSPYIVIKPSWGVLDYAHKGNLITEAGDDDRTEEGDESDRSRSSSGMDRYQDEQVVEENEEKEKLSEVNRVCGVIEDDREMDFCGSLSSFGVRELEDDEDEKEQEEPTKEESSYLIMEDPSSVERKSQVCNGEDASPEIPPQHLEFFLGHDGFRLIPVELIDSTTEENQTKSTIKEEDDENCDKQEADSGSESAHESRVESVLNNHSSPGDVEAEVSAHEIEEEAKFAVLESMEIEEDENSFVFHARQCDLVREVYEHVEPQTSSKDVHDGQETSASEAKKRDSNFSAEAAYQMPINETEAEAEAEADVSIGTEIPDLETTDEFQNQEILSSYTCVNEDPSTSSANFSAEEDHGFKQVEEEPVELKTISVELGELSTTKETPLGSEANETEEERVPDTPTSIDSFHHLHKKLLLLERKESGTEESLDGSVISEFEGGEGVMTIEHLKTALRSERKALHALYAELEEERSASAVAANQTMAMINRLQEEKAAMQMEALQYQRMMEEQSEYDQEALQLLNELMVKREKEKQELERELEVYKKKVLEYEAKEKMRVLRNSRNGSSRSGSPSASSSNSGDSDGQEDGFGQENGNHSTPIDAVLDLEDSLASFEEERLSILEQLKVLEEKLFTLSDEEEQHFEDIKPIEDFYEENGKYSNGNSDEANGFANGFPKEMNGKIHQEGRLMGAKGKRLLPLFDAISAEDEERVENGHVNGFDSDVLQFSDAKRIEIEGKKLAVEEEVDHLYERLQALEADREFLKHCISSLKKGDKGMDLLQEILQHLRDLKNVELRVKNLNENGLM